MGLDELAPFKPEEKIIEYMLQDKNDSRLVSMPLMILLMKQQVKVLHRVVALLLLILVRWVYHLATMVANLSSHKKGWDERWEEFSNWAEKGQQFKDELLRLVDADTKAFNSIMHAMSLPKGTDEEKAVRKQAMNEATKVAIEVPFQVMKLSYDSMEVIKQWQRLVILTVFLMLVLGHFVPAVP
jgi:glutamate formiminotransferase/formiminotetrahydrofolate cyclodeaminase